MWHSASLPQDNTTRKNTTGTGHLNSSDPSLILVYCFWFLDLTRDYTCKRSTMQVICILI